MNPKAASFRVAIYARQSVAEELGIEQQESDCRDYLAVAHKAAVISDVYRDNAVSATKERGAKSDWARMLRDFDAGLFDAVVCVRVDRLLRRVVDVVELRNRERGDVRVMAFGSSLDTGEAMGNAMLTILVALAESEIEIKNQRTKRYAVERRAKGHPTPGRVPYGYRWVSRLERDDAGTRFAVIPEEAEIVKSIYAEALAVGSSRATIAGIARRLNESGKRTRGGSRWGSTVIRHILASPYYAAKLPPKLAEGARYKVEDVAPEKCIPGAWEAIVTEAQWLAARSQVLDPSRRTNGGIVARKWLLGGLARCGTCATPVRSAVTREGFHGYRCPNGHFLRRGEILDDYVTQVAVQRLSESDAVKLLTPPATGPDMGTLTGLRAALDERERVIGRLVATGQLGEDAAAEGLAILRTERASIVDQIAALVNIDPLAEIVSADDVRGMWDSYSLERKRTIVQALFVPVIRPVGKGVRVRDLEDAKRSMSIIWRDWEGKEDSQYFLESDLFTPGALSSEASETVAAATT